MRKKGKVQLKVRLASDAVATIGPLEAELKQLKDAELGAECDELTFRQAIDKEGRHARVGIVHFRIDPEADETAEDQLIDAYRAGRRRLQDAGGTGVLRRNRAMKGHQPRSDSEALRYAVCWDHHYRAGNRPLRKTVADELGYELTSGDKIKGDCLDRRFLESRRAMQGRGKNRQAGPLTRYGKQRARVLGLLDE